MKTSFQVQTPKTPDTETLQSLLTSRIEENKFDVARIAAAYVTVSGVRSLLTAFQKHKLTTSYWLVGLDDAVTQPGAIDYLLSLKDATVQVATYEDLNLRFHSKYFSFSKSNTKSVGLGMIGSANVTAQALAGNGESVAFVECENAQDHKSLAIVWSQLWKQGHKPTKSELEAYKSRYEKRVLTLRKSGSRKRPTKPKPREVLTSDSAELDPSMADTCWIECGKVTAMGRELEFKAEQSLFFGLNPTGGNPVMAKFTVSNGDEIELRMKYQQNHMWRLQMNNEVPEVKAGLRKKLPDGKQGRSPYVAVFEKNRNKKVFELTFIRLTSREFKKLLAKTERVGTVGRTKTRQYGWC